MSTPLDREAGITAVVALQALSGIDESREDAAEGWDAMTLENQEWTMGMYRMLLVVQEEEKAELESAQIKETFPKPKRVAARAKRQE